MLAMSNDLFVFGLKQSQWQQKRTNYSALASTMVFQRPTTIIP